MLPGKARCAVCDCQITRVQANLYNTCDHWKCRQQHRAVRETLRKQKAERERRQREEVKRRVRNLRDKVAGALGIDRPESFAPLPVPARETAVTELPAERRDEFRDHLRELIREASKQRQASLDGPPEVETSADAADGNSEQSPILGGACATCEGYCCGQGGNHAYLDVQTILRYMDQHPRKRPRNVLAAFLSRLGKRTYQDSCVYHGKNGCRLPRGMRSATCNTFECTQLRRVWAEFSGSGPHRAFVAALDGNQIVRFAFVREDQRLNKVHSHPISNVSRSTAT